MLLIPFFGFAQTQVGEEVLLNYNTPHPYSGNSKNSYALHWKQEIIHPGASYIAVHFKKINLSKEDYIVIRDSDNVQSWHYSYDEIENKKNNFWSIPIYNEKIILELYSKNSNGNYGYHIDKIAAGYRTELLGKREKEAVCGKDDSRNAKCYSISEPTVYTKSKAVARLLINGTSACTGWLIGDDGHLMTNEHCIQNQSDAKNVTIEFMAEGSNCGINCDSWFACPGKIEATSATLVKGNTALDYALLALAKNVSGTYGYLQLRGRGASLNERIYIPQHPGAWGKRIALNSTDVNDQGGVARIFSLNRPRCSESSGTDIGYYADTQGGSSGSPVLGYTDNLVVALHHCAYCPNRGVPIEEIITHLGAALPNNALPSFCKDHLTISKNVSANNTDNQSAKNTITAKNIIYNKATVNYDAGENVYLKPGFAVGRGGEFRAFIEGCSGTGIRKSVPKVVAAKSEISGDSTSENLEKSAIISIYPNPVDAILNIKANKTIKNLKILNTQGQSIKFLNNGELNSIPTADLSPGIYFVEINFEDSQIARKKIVKKF